MRILLAIILTVLSLGWSRTAAAETERFVVCYGQDAALEGFAPYSRAVLDGDHHPPLAPLKARSVQLFGYVSLGEADAARWYYPDAAGLLLGPNPNWPGAHYVDLRNPAWHTLVLDRIVPGVLAEGFGGLFLDTLDDAAFLEHADPVHNGGMIEAAAALVREIHRRHPTVPLMLNRAYEVAALVTDQLDTVLAESLTSSYDFQTRRYHLRNKSDLDWGLAKVAELRRLAPKLKLYSLDYWDPADRDGIVRLYARERKAGLVPYVATIDLQRIVPEPAPPGWRWAR